MTTPNKDVLNGLAARVAKLNSAILKANEGTGGEYWANGDTYDLIFRPGGGNYMGGDRTVARCACGGLAPVMAGLLAEAMNLIPELHSALANEEGR